MSYFECRKCGGTFHPSYRWCPVCDTVTVEHTEQLRRFNDHMDRIAAAPEQPGMVSVPIDLARTVRDKLCLMDSPNNSQGTWNDSTANAPRTVLEAVEIAVHSGNTKRVLDVIRAFIKTEDTLRAELEQARTAHGAAMALRLDMMSRAEAAEAREAALREILHKARNWIANRTVEFGASNFTDRYGYADSGKVLLAAIDTASMEELPW